MKKWHVIWDTTHSKHSLNVKKLFNTYWTLPRSECFPHLEDEDTNRKDKNHCSNSVYIPEQEDRKSKSDCTWLCILPGGAEKNKSKCSTK